MFDLPKNEKIREGKLIYQLIKITNYLVSSSIGQSALKVVVALAVVVAAADGRALRAAVGADQLRAAVHRLRNILERSVDFFVNFG